MGKRTARAVFTGAQNRALRTALRGMQSERSFSQLEVGRVLGIAQQNAGRLLNEESGFSYDTATRLARLLGFAGVDAFFAAKGLRASDGQRAQQH